jgi:SAM-dependent methyltransferase
MTHGHGHGHGHGPGQGSGEGPGEIDPETHFTAEFWDARYAAHDAVWSGRPNVTLVELAGGLAAGDALDVGCGEGADAVWLAGRGWRVTGVDVSTVALDRAAAAAKEAGVAGRVTVRQVDIFTFEPEPASYDLVTSHFMHLPAEPRVIVTGRLAAAVRPGGSLLVVGHHVSDLETTVGRPNVPDLFFSAEDVAATLDPAAWEIVVAAAPSRDVIDPEGDTVTIKDAVLHAVRRA